MKIQTILIIFSLFSVPVWADDISVTVNGRTYHCSGSDNGGRCERKAELFGQQLDYCAKSAYGHNCAKKLWPGFKQRNPHCIDEAALQCIRVCSKSAYEHTCVHEICAM